MNNSITFNELKHKLFRKLFKYKYNRFFIFDFENENMPTVNFSGNEGAFYQDYLESEIRMRLITGELLFLLWDYGIWNNRYDEMIGRPAYVEGLDNMSEEDFWDFIYEITTILAGAYISTEIERELYKKFKDYDVNYYDIYVYNCHTKPYTKTFANLTFHINDYECRENIENVSNCFGPNTHIDTLKTFIHPKTKYFWGRYENRVGTQEGVEAYYNDVNGDYFSINYFDQYDSMLIHCRNLIFAFNYESNAYNETVVNFVDNSLSQTKQYRVATEIRLILTGAGDISYEERLDNEGKLTGYDIYVEKEYDESYIREYDNVTFHVNDGYVHKTEQERLEDYLKDNADKIKTVQDVVNHIMYPLQVTKASRFLCYKLKNEDEDQPIIYFNGGEGDFYLKAYEDMLVFHCRDMAIVFNANETVIDDSRKVDMCIEDDDFIMFYKDEASKNMVDIFSVVYEIIFTLAGAGEVKYEMTTEESGVNRYIISLEKEYIKPYSKNFGNISMDVMEEKTLNNVH